MPMRSRILNLCNNSRGLAAVVAVVACAMLVGGCAEHRISVDEFLEMQRTLAPPPADAQADEPLKLDAYLTEYKVGPGDVLEVTLSNGEKAGLFSTLQVRVDRNGEVDLPFVGAVQIGDLELEDVENTIRATYVPTYVKDSVIHVAIVSVDTTNVLVVGAVTDSGIVPLRRNERTLLFAIVGAGGVSQLASGHATLRRIRRPTESMTFNLTDPRELNKSLQIDPLEDGDIVSVHAAMPNTVFVGGLVYRGGPQMYPAGSPATVLQALAAAGGVRTDVFPTEGTLIRRMPDGSDVHVKLDLRRMAKGQTPNLVLAAGDILWVPETTGTRVMQWFNSNIFFRAGVSVNYSVSGIEFMNRSGQQSRNSGNVGGGNLESSFDPFGFLGQNQALQVIGQQTGG